MEFSFNVNDYLKNEITEVNNSLIPSGFTGDRRSMLDCTQKMTEILDDMGVASAKAQDLKKPITSSEKTRNSDHLIYFLVDKNGKGGAGTVVGLLKVGWKELYLYDIRGAHHKMKALCVLDFYIHESKQRVGCGKYLYEHMLQDQQIKPEQLAIDRPSDKFIGFLYKHYGLETMIPQANNYVVFADFFIHQDGTSMIDSLNSKNSNPKFLESFPTLDGNKREFNGLQDQVLPLYGRHAALKPGSTMGKILQNPIVDPTCQKSMPTSAAGSQNGSRSTSPERRTSHSLQDQVPKSLFLHSNLW